MTIRNIVLGGWYQRTTLHLSEVYDLFDRGISRLPLSATKLKTLHEGLALKQVERNASYFEYIQALTQNGIQIRFYEDGLFTLTSSGESVKEITQKLNDYYHHKLTPAINYIFSLGAPTPKVLANIHSIPPIAIQVLSKNFDKLDEEITAEFGQVYSKVMTDKVALYKTPEYIVVSSDTQSDQLTDLVENQIFFREFKDQLERYLDIHRTLWEGISRIKERKSIKGTQIVALQNELEGIQKTITLIESRLNQMGSYIRTRADIAKNQKVEAYLSTLFQYKFETLADTHAYIKEIWRMTKDYLGSAIQVFSNVQAASTKDSISSLRLISTIGVLSGIIGYLSRDSLPKVNTYGVIWFAFLLVATWILNKTIGYIYSHIKYPLKFVNHKKL